METLKATQGHYYPVGRAPPVNSRFQQTPRNERAGYFPKSGERSLQCAGCLAESERSFPRMWVNSIPGSDAVDSGLPSRFSFPGRTDPKSRSGTLDIRSSPCIVS